MVPVGINRLWREFLKSLKEQGMSLQGDPSELKVDVYSSYLDSFDVLALSAKDFTDLYVEEMLNEPMRVSDSTNSSGCTS